MNNPNIKSKAVCILGMHRSGTSAISRTMNILGAYLGEDADIMNTAQDNPAGFWEIDDITNLHDDLLHVMKKTWHTILPLPDKWYESDEIKPFREKIVEIVTLKFKDKELWVWKDPRTSILFPLWRDILKKLDIELSCIFMVRNPLDVAKSLEKRDGFSHDKSFGVWYNYNIAALQTTIDVPKVFISYDNLLNNWEPELRRCTSILNITWPEDNARVKETVDTFLSPDLCHSTSTLKDLKEKEVPRPVIELYGLLEGLADAPTVNDSALTREVERISGEFLSYACFFQHDMKRLWELEQQNLKLSHRLFETEQQLIKTESQLTEKEGRIQALLNSFSWKITEPLRKCFSLFTKRKENE